MAKVILDDGSEIPLTLGEQLWAYVDGLLADFESWDDERLIQASQSHYRQKGLFAYPAQTRIRQEMKRRGLGA